jgi:ACR3 family arsenite efflux pump ArsB
MAFRAWIFIRGVFVPILPADQIDSYIAGMILLAAVPCTAKVVVWSRRTNGDPYFTLSQVALNDTIMIFAFAPNHAPDQARVARAARLSRTGSAGNDFAYAGTHGYAH